MQKRTSSLLLVGSLFVLFSLTTIALPQNDRGIPVTFELDEPSHVTLVIENEDGKRVRNLINDTHFEAGEHTIYWDGYNVGDKKGKDQKLDVYRTLVEPGTYRVRGLTHKDIKLEYRDAVQSPGTPPWHTNDRSGGWLADHTPPQSAIYLPGGTPANDEPQVAVTASVAEAGHCIMWLDQSGEKQYGSKFAGWQGPCQMAIDRGNSANASHYLYAGVFKNETIHIYGLRDDSKRWNHKNKLYEHPVNTDDFDEGKREEIARTGLAVQNGTIAFIPPLKDKLYFIDPEADGDKKIGSVDLDDPRGMALDDRGRLYVLEGSTVRRYDQPSFSEGQLGNGRTIVKRGLSDPREVTYGADGKLYVGDWGDHNQVMVYGTGGKREQVIGKSSSSIQHGRYDEKKMWHPAGLAVDGNGKLWVAELNYAPKRISRWDAGTGEFDRAYYGPPRYGGGGRVDPRDEHRFFYPSGMQGIEFRKDPETGRFKPHSIYWHTDHNKGRCPGTPVYHNGEMYMVNTFIGPAYFLAQDAQVYRYDEETATVKCVGWVGSASRKGFKGRFLDKYTDENPELKRKAEEGWKDGHWKTGFGAWSDLNLDGEPQPEEIQTVNFGRDTKWGRLKRTQCGVSFTRNFEIATTSGIRIPEANLNEDGVPVWNLEQWEAAAYRNEHLSDVLVTPDDFFLFTMGGYHTPRVARSYRDGELAWKINGVGGAGVPDPVASYRGQLVNAQRHIGFPFQPEEGEGGWMYVLNGYHGSVYVLTSDGLYVTDLGGDQRTHPTLSVPEARRGMIVDDVSWGDEHFWPATVQMKDGTIKFIAGGQAENLIFNVKNLGSINRLEPRALNVTQEMLDGKPAKKVEPGEARERTRELQVQSSKPTLDGTLDDWDEHKLVDVNERFGIRAGVSVSGETLYAAWSTDRPELLNNNAPDGWKYAFATDGGLDLMLRPRYNEGFKRPHNQNPGDLRLFVTRTGNPKNGDVLAVLFRQEDGQGPLHKYSSPVDEVEFDTVRRISDQVKLAQDGGDFELAVPLPVLGLDVQPGISTRGDLGVILGNGSEANARLYWNNKGANMVSDIPTEARLEPGRWGNWTFE